VSHIFDHFVDMPGSAAVRTCVMCLHARSVLSCWPVSNIPVAYGESTGAMQYAATCHGAWQSHTGRHHPTQPTWSNGATATDALSTVMYVSM